MSVSSVSNGNSRTIRVGALARVEGEGALHLAMKEGRVESVNLEIYEPPRFFEAFLRGRAYSEVPDITARICGICPVAYQMGSCHAIEKAFGQFDEVTPAIRELRTLLYCGEWIESHALHMFMLHLPDFLGYESAISMAADHGDAVRAALRIKKLGNDLMTAVAGRAVHPVGVCVGGFYKAPSVKSLRSLLAEIRACRDVLSELLLFLAEKLDYPDLDRDYEFVALCPDAEYPMNLGRIKSNKGIDIDPEDYLQVIEERHVPHSTALHAVVKQRGAYSTGPLARLNLNADKLHRHALALLPQVVEAVRRPLPWQNNFLSLPARGLETIHALSVAEDLIEGYELPTHPRIAIKPRAGKGGHGTEAPRGICWHQYETDAEGSITAATIMAPTGQNQLTIEQDLFELAQRVVELPDEEAALKCEHLIRNYDPCISCSVHFLKFKRTHG